MLKFFLDGKLTRPNPMTEYQRSLTQKYLIFASTDRIFYGVCFFLLYTAIGPWSFHEVLDEHVAYYFVWGMFVKGLFIPGTLNWWYGFHQVSLEIANERTFFLLSLLQFSVDVLPIASDDYNPWCALQTVQKISRKASRNTSYLSRRYLRSSAPKKPSVPCSYNSRVTSCHFLFDPKRIFCFHYCTCPCLGFASNALPFLPSTLENLRSRF